jgi:hypothetical protein
MTHLAPKRKPANVETSTFSESNCRDSRENNIPGEIPTAACRAFTLDPIRLFPNFWAMRVFEEGL